MGQTQLCISKISAYQDSASEIMQKREWFIKTINEYIVTATSILKNILEIQLLNFEGKDKMIKELKAQEAEAAAFRNKIYDLNLVITEERERARNLLEKADNLDPSTLESIAGAFFFPVAIFSGAKEARNEAQSTNSC